MSTDRNRVQPGVSTGGQFAKENKPEDSAVALALQGSEHSPIELDRSESYDIPGDQDAVWHYGVHRDDEGNYTTAVQMRDVSYSELLAHGVDHELSTEALDEVVRNTMNRGDVLAFEDAFNERYGEDGAEIVYSGDEDSIQVDLNRSYDHAPSEYETVNDSWPQIARQANEMDPGTYGSEFFGRIAKDHMDAQATMQVPRGQLRPRDPDAETPADRARRQAMIGASLHADAPLLDQYVQEIADEHADKDPAIKQLATKGYANAGALQNIDDGGHQELQALKVWASKSKPFSERLEANIEAWQDW